MTNPTRQVLITGGAGRVAKVIVPVLAQYYNLRLLDRLPIPDAPDAFSGDINDSALLDRAVAGCEAVIHLAGIPYVSATFEELIEPNIRGTNSIYEAARRNGVRRVVLASTHHVTVNINPLREEHTAAHWKESKLAPVQLPYSPAVGVRADSPYAASKAFGEALATYYADWFGVTSVCLRLGSITVEPDSPYLQTPRCWALWMSARDLAELFHRSVEAEGIGSVIVYGCSHNTRRWWDLAHMGDLIGFVPQDDSEQFIPDWYRDGLVPPAPAYPLPWGERLAELPVQAGRAMLVWIGQSGFFLKTFAGHKFVVDPFLTVWPDRIEPPLLSAVDLPADTILITHTHRDHLDVYALPIIAQARPQARFIGPPTVRAKLRELGIADERIVALRPGETHTVADAHITAIPARHQDTAPDAQGYVIRTGEVTLYHTGDTEYDPCLMAAREHHPALLIAPINGRGGNMSAEQAALLAADLAPKAVIPMHYGCLQPRADLLDRFLAALSRAAPRVASAVMEVGAIARLPLA